MTGTSLGSPVGHTHHASPVHEPPAAIRATGIIVVLTVVLAILAIAFALPAARSKPHDVPIGAAGPQAASGQIADMLEQHAPGAFAITYYPGEAALRDAIRNRDVYGGISFGPDGGSLLIATGGSPMVAQMLTQIGNGIAQQAGVPLHTEDLAPPSADDPRGAGIADSHWVRDAAHFETLMSRRFDEGGPLLLAAKIDDQGGTAQTPRDPALIRQRFMRGLGTGRQSALDA